MKFWVKYKNESYSGDACDGMSLDMIWNSQMGWFSEGSEVTIEDERGNKKTFIKGEIVNEEDLK